MTSSAALKRQAERLRDVERGEWVRFCGSYWTNAFEVSYSEQGYLISIERGDAGTWHVSAEDHEPEDLVASGYQPPGGFRTLAEAKEAAIEFAKHFVSCYQDNAVYEAAIAPANYLISFVVWGDSPTIKTVIVRRSLSQDAAIESGGKAIAAAYPNLKSDWHTCSVVILDPNPSKTTAEPDVFWLDS